MRPSALSVATHYNNENGNLDVEINTMRGAIFFLLSYRLWVIIIRTLCIRYYAQCFAY